VATHSEEHVLLAVVGLSPDAGLDDVKRARQLQARLVHPDRMRDRPEDERRAALQRMQDVNAACDRLIEIIRDREAHAEREQAVTRDRQAREREAQAAREREASRQREATAARERAAGAVRAREDARRREVAREREAQAVRDRPVIALICFGAAAVSAVSAVGFTIGIAAFPGSDQSSSLMAALAISIAIACSAWVVPFIALLITKSDGVRAAAAAAAKFHGIWSALAILVLPVGVCSLFLTDVAASVVPALVGTTRGIVALRGRPVTYSVGKLRYIGYITVGLLLGAVHVLLYGLFAGAPPS
jgi:hypothetical protein